MRGVARVQGEVCSTLLFDSDSGASPIKGDADERRSHDASRGAVAEASDPDLGGTAAVRRSAGAPLLTVIFLATHLMLGAGAFPALDRLAGRGLAVGSRVGPITISARLSASRPSCTTIPHV
jgi:hypothetical protein